TGKATTSEPILHDAPGHSFTLFPDLSLTPFAGPSAAPVAPPVWLEDGRLLTVLGHEVRVWDGNTGQPRTPPLRHDRFVEQATFGPAAKRLPTVRHDQARVWPPVPGQPLTPAMKHIRKVESATFSPDGRLVLTLSQFEVRVWDAATGEPVTPVLTPP